MNFKNNKFKHVCETTFLVLCSMSLGALLVLGAFTNNLLTCH